MQKEGITMYAKLRILFTILSAICIAAAIPLGIFFDLPAVILSILGALVFLGLMLLCKSRAEDMQQKADPQPPTETDKQD